MVNDSSPRSRGLATGARRLLDRLKSRDNRVGLLPTEGWRKRNVNFFRHVLLPTLMRPRKPRHDVDPVPSVIGDQLGVTWLGHAGFLVQMDGSNILIDPNWALWHGPAKRYRHPSLYPSDMPAIDLVLITHAHFDHLHLASLKRIACGQPIVLPLGVGNLVQKLNFGSITELPNWGRVTFGDLTITLTPARHWGARYIHDTHREFGGYLIEGKTRNLYHCGDSAMFDGFAEIGERAAIDAALMPIGAYEPPSGRPVHMNPEEALLAFTQTRAGVMVPMHYDTFPISGEPPHEPAERLAKAASEQSLIERVPLLREGDTLVL
jgi:L-ascorbate metabolism protein UlaG (beta-lactamase superfamily)